MEKLAILELNESILRVSIYKISNGRFQLALEKSQNFALGKEINSEELIKPKTKNETQIIFSIFFSLNPNLTHYF